MKESELQLAEALLNARLAVELEMQERYERSVHQLHLQIDEPIGKQETALQRLRKLDFLGKNKLP